MYFFLIHVFFNSDKVEVQKTIDPSEVYDESPFGSIIPGMKRFLNLISCFVTNIK